MDILIKICQFFLCFTILIGIHELGHFLMARVFRIRVEKFYIFFDPWFSIFKFRRGETEYGLGWLPLGGYCKIAGMIDESMDKEYQNREPQPWEFRSKPAWKRFLVMIAGVVMNVLLAVGIYIGICYAWGDAYFSNQDAKWGYNFNEAAHELGFRDGDRFVSIDGEEVDNISEILNALIITEGDRTVIVERDGRQVSLTLPLEELIAMRREKGYENFISLPQPFVTAACAQNEALSVVLNMNEQWDLVQGEGGSRMVTGVTVVRDEFLEEHPEAVRSFLEEHEASTQAINTDPEKGAQLVAAAGITANEAIAMKAIPECNITYIDGKEMQQALSGYLQVLFDQDPASVGGALPGEDFYYIP